MVLYTWVVVLVSFRVCVADIFFFVGDGLSSGVPATGEKAATTPAFLPAEDNRTQAVGGALLPPSTF